jgi:hypothetical protein
VIAPYREKEDAFCGDFVEHSGPLEADLVGTHGADFPLDRAFKEIMKVSIAKGGRVQAGARDVL